MAAWKLWPDSPEKKVKSSLYLTTCEIGFYYHLLMPTFNCNQFHLCTYNRPTFFTGRGIMLTGGSLTFSTPSQDSSYTAPVAAFLPRDLNPGTWNIATEKKWFTWTRIRQVFIPNHTFLVRFGGISAEFGRAMVRILARPNEPDMPPKHTKKVWLGFYRTQIFSPKFSGMESWQASSSLVLAGKIFAPSFNCKIPPKF